ncbi:MAG: hypothetical protein F6K24_47910 [Okeania sp. SIO2D1]|nr:hypothetical protein [Okeania sp. SIO2D1]
MSKTQRVNFKSYRYLWIPRSLLGSVGANGRLLLRISITIPQLDLPHRDINHHPTIMFVQCQYQSPSHNYIYPIEISITLPQLSLSNANINHLPTIIFVQAK